VDVRILLGKIDVLAFKKVYVLGFFALFQSGEGFSGALKSVYQLLNSSVSHIDSYVSLSLLQPSSVRVINAEVRVDHRFEASCLHLFAPIVVFASVSFGCRDYFG
jgi:hypothetical protein